MTAHRVMSLDELEAEMRAVARGERRSPPDAREASFESLEALARLLTPANRSVLRIIRDEKPSSVAALARRLDRPEPSLTRDLEELAGAGLLALRTTDGLRVPEVLVREVQVTIDPYERRDRIEMA